MTGPAAKSPGSARSCQGGQSPCPSSAAQVKNLEEQTQLSTELMVWCWQLHGVAVIPAASERRKNALATGTCSKPCRASVMARLRSLLPSEYQERPWKELFWFRSH